MPISSARPAIPNKSKEEAMPKKYEVMCTIRLFDDDTTVADFEREVDLFNKANKGQIQVTLGTANEVPFEHPVVLQAETEG